MLGWMRGIRWQQQHQHRQRSDCIRQWPQRRMRPPPIWLPRNESSLLSYTTTTVNGPSSVIRSCVTTRLLIDYNYGPTDSIRRYSSCPSSLLSQLTNIETEYEYKYKYEYIINKNSNGNGNGNHTRRPRRPNGVTSSTKGAEAIARGVEELLQKPVGFFQYPTDFDQAQYWIHNLIHDRDSANAARYSHTIDKCLDLWERVVREYSLRLVPTAPTNQPNDDTVPPRASRSSSNNTTTATATQLREHETLWFCRPTQLNLLLNLWKQHVLRKWKVVPPRDIVLKLKTMEALLPAQFRYDIVTMNHIMGAIIGQEPPNKAPLVAESLLEFVKAEASSKTGMRPTNCTYGIVMQAWSVSGLANAQSKMETIMEIVYRNDCSADTPVKYISVVPYRIRLRYWAAEKHAGKVDALLNMMDRSVRLQAKLNGSLLHYAIECYTQVGQISKAEDMFHRMLKVGTSMTNVSRIDDTKESIVLGILLGSNHLLKYYGQVIVTTIGTERDYSATIERIVQQNVERAETVMEQTQAFRDMDAKSGGTWWWYVCLCPTLSLSPYIFVKLLVVVAHFSWWTDPTSAHCVFVLCYNTYEYFFFFAPLRSSHAQHHDGHICTCETYAVVHDISSNIHSVPWHNLSFPNIVKPLTAAGTKANHAMTVIMENDNLNILQSILRDRSHVLVFLLEGGV
jgi:pentatricopeptide repeat protein